MKIAGPFIIAVMASVNFQQTTDKTLDFIEPIITLGLLIVIEMMLAGCLD